MANHGLFVGWNRPIPGREQDARESFSQALGYWAGLQKAGKIESFEPVLLARHGGDMNGFFLIRGDEDKLHEIKKSEDYKKLIMAVDHYVMGFGAVDVVLGDELVDQMKRWSELISKK